MHRLVAVALVAALPSVAGAADCEAPYDFDTLLNDLGAAEAGLRAMDYAAAMKSATAMRDGLPCLDQVAPIIVVPRALRAIAAGLYVGGEPEEAAKWFRTAAALDPGFDYGAQDLPPNHPIVRAWKAAKADPAGAPEPADITLGEGSHWLDGKPLETPAAAPGAMHVYQYQTDRVRTWVIEGPAFPREATGWVPEPPPVAVVTQQAAPPTSPVAPVVPPPVEIGPRRWPAERVALVGGGVVALAGSGVLYALSADARGRFDTANSVTELDRWRGQTNAYAIGSGAALVAGASALGVGALFFLVDGDPRPTLDLRF